MGDVYVGICEVGVVGIILEDVMIGAAARHGQRDIYLNAARHQGRRKIRQEHPIVIVGLGLRPPHPRLKQNVKLPENPVVGVVGSNGPVHRDIDVRVVKTVAVGF